MKKIGKVRLEGYFKLLTQTKNSLNLTKPNVIFFISTIFSSLPQNSMSFKPSFRFVIDRT